MDEYQKQFIELKRLVDMVMVPGLFMPQVFASVIFSKSAEMIMSQKDPEFAFEGMCSAIRIMMKSISENSDNSDELDELDGNDSSDPA